MMSASLSHFGSEPAREFCRAGTSLLTLKLPWLKTVYVYVCNDSGDDWLLSDSLLQELKNLSVCWREAEAERQEHGILISRRCHSCLHWQPVPLTDSSGAAETSLQSTFKLKVTEVRLLILLLGYTMRTHV